MATTIII